MRVVKLIATILFFCFTACDKSAIDACKEPEIDMSAWNSFGSESIASVWDGHLSLKMPERFKPKSFTSQHGGYLYKSWFSRFEILNGFWGEDSFIHGYEPLISSSCVVNINGHDVLITTSKGRWKYYISAWQLGGDPWEYGYTHAYVGESFSRKTQVELLATIRSIQFTEYIVPDR